MILSRIQWSMKKKKKKKGKTKQKRKIKRKKRKKKFNSFHTRISNSGSASPGQLDELIEKSKSGARESWKQRENVMKFGVNVAAIIGHVTSVGRAREPLPPFLPTLPSPLLPVVPQPTRSFQGERTHTEARSLMLVDQIDSRLHPAATWHVHKRLEKNGITRREGREMIIKLVSLSKRAS